MTESGKKITLVGGYLFNFLTKTKKGGKLIEVNKGAADQGKNSR
jgi:hypothetical protein